jgi:hypothetical protein
VLGLEPDLPAGQIGLDPVLPPGATHLELRGMALGADRVTIAVHGHAVDVEGLSGPLTVTRGSTREHETPGHETPEHETPEHERGRVPR